MEYTVEKRIWTEEDYDQMGWHDCHIYKIKLTEDLALDIDYIFKWNDPEVEGLPYTFWIAPSTLVFRNVHKLEFEIETLSDVMEIQDVERHVDKEDTIWQIITHQGTFTFQCDGFTQYVRQEANLQFGQTISYLERDGHSLERTTNQDNPNLSKKEIIDKEPVVGF